MRHTSAKFKATAPGVITKTKRDYFWLLPDELNDTVQVIRELDSTGFTDFKDLKESLRSFFSN